jgi:hypothetical protein
MRRGTVRFTTTNETNETNEKETKPQTNRTGLPLQLPLSLVWFVWDSDCDGNLATVLLSKLFFIQQTWDNAMNTHTYRTYMFI